MERAARPVRALLPGLQRGLPVPEAYKREKPGTDSDLNAYDAVYYAGQANAGSKTIAINLPNDEQVQLKKGTRRLQLKNAMRAKFDKILVPIAEELIADDQQQHIMFDAFFANIMFHEVAHGLGIKNTINGKGTVRDALKEQAGALEEGKADILGLYMITRLQRAGRDAGRRSRRQLRDLPGRDLPLDALRRRQGARPGQRGGVLLPQERGAFTRDSATGRYRVDFAKMRSAVDSMAGAILRLQGDGDYAGVTAFMAERGTITPGPVRPRPARPEGSRWTSSSNRVPPCWGWSSSAPKGRIMDIDPVKRPRGCGCSADRRAVRRRRGGLGGRPLPGPLKQPILPRAVEVSDVQSAIEQEATRCASCNGGWSSRAAEPRGIHPRRGRNQRRRPVPGGDRARDENSDTLHVPAPAPGQTASGYSCVAASPAGDSPGRTAPRGNSSGPPRAVRGLRRPAGRQAAPPRQVSRIVVQPEGIQVDPDVGGRCAAWQRQHPGTSVWIR